MADIKTDILHFCSSKSQVSELEHRVKQLEIAGAKGVGDNERELKQVITQMQAYPTMMHALQL